VGSLFAAACMTALWTRPVLAEEGISGALLPPLAVALCCLVSFYYNDLYDLRAVRGLREFAPRLLQSLALASLLLVIGYAALPVLRVHTGRLAAMVVVGAALVLPVRTLCYRVLVRRGAAHRVLILGTGPLARKIAAELDTSPHLRFSVVGFVDDTGMDGVVLGRPLRPLDRACEAINELRPDFVVVALTERRGRLPVWSLLASCANGVPVEDGIDFYEGITQKLAIESLTPSAFIFSRALRPRRLQLALRRGAGLLLSLVGLVLTAPLLALIAASIKLDSDGPVFFVQERAGRGGRIFRLIKFRTMRQLPAGESESVWHRDVGSRVTRVGRWLRRLHLDELPQLINVIKGDMAVIGPRPEMACNVRTMTEQIPYFPLRHTVPPGVTGWAQIKQGYSMSRDEVEEKIRYDLYYVRHMSVWLDLKILVDTAKIVFLGRNAA